MNRRMVLHTLCIIMRIEAAVMIPALIIALYMGEESSAYGFVCAMVILAAVSFATLLAKPRTRALYARDGMFIVALGWIGVSLFGSIPFYISGAIPNPVDALFETVSGFSTTGATILTDIEALPVSMLYWRSFTHWLGGMGVLVFVLAIIPLAKNQGHTLHLLRAESPGPQVDRLVPKVQSTAKWLYGIYIIMTILEVVFLLAGGLTPFESITTAFSTAGTGGFSIYNDSLASFSIYAQNVVIVFMLLFGINFNIFYMLAVREYRRIAKNQELWLYLIIAAVSTFAITLNVLPFFGNSSEIAAQQSLFQVSSLITTTGFSTQNYILWPAFPQMLLMLLVCIGACAGSTSGGFKLSRLIILVKSFVRDIKKVFRPKEVSNIRLNGSVLEERTVMSVKSFLAAFIIIVVISIIIISLDGFDYAVNVTASLTCISNGGPGLGMVGPEGNYHAFSNLSKFVLMFDMLAGRLEIFPLLVLLVPSAWKR